MTHNDPVTFSVSMDLYDQVREELPTAKLIEIGIGTKPSIWSISLPLGLSERNECKRKIIAFENQTENMTMDKNRAVFHVHTKLHKLVREKLPSAILKQLARGDLENGRDMWTISMPETMQEKAKMAKTIAELEKMTWSDSTELAIVPKDPDALDKKLPVYLSETVSQYNLVTPLVGGRMSFIGGLLRSMFQYRSDQKLAAEGHGETGVLINTSTNRAYNTGKQLTLDDFSMMNRLRLAQGSLLLLNSTYNIQSYLNPIEIVRVSRKEIFNYHGTLMDYDGDGAKTLGMGIVVSVRKVEK